MKSQRWLACRKVFVPWEMPKLWWYASAILVGCLLAQLTLWLAGCAVHKQPQFKPENEDASYIGCHTKDGDVFVAGTPNDSPKCPEQK